MEIGGPHGSVDLYASHKKLTAILARSLAALWAATRINPESSASELARLIVFRTTSLIHCMGQTG